MEVDPPKNQIKKMTKDFIKTLPAWEYFDKVRANIKLLEHDVECYVDRLDEEVNKSKKLPDINLTNSPIVLPYNSARNDADLVCLKISRTANGYDIMRDNNTVKLVTPDEESPKDPSRIECLKLLEEAIEHDHEVFAMVYPGKPWVRCKVRYIQRRQREKDGKPWMRIRVATLKLTDGISTVIDATKYSIARTKNFGNKLKLTKRVIAGISESKLMPGIIGNEPFEENKYRYLVLMDGGSASYFKPEQVFPIVGQSALPWQDSRYLSSPSSSNDENVAHLRQFFASYPKRYMLAYSAPGTPLDLIRNGNLVSSKIISFDCDTVRVLYKDNSEENIYRGSPRVLKRADVASKLNKNSRNLEDFDPKIVIFANDYFKAGQRAIDEDFYRLGDQFEGSCVISSNRTARKSTTQKRNPKRVRVRLDQQVFNEDRDSQKILTREQIDSRSHKCTSDCLKESNGVRTENSIENVNKEFIDVSDLKVPLLLGWKRQIRLLPTKDQYRPAIVYEAPCGKFFQKSYDIRRHLMNIGSKLDIDYFTFEKDLDLNRQTRDLEANYFIQNIAADSVTGEPLENKLISLVNIHNEERLPQDFSYVSQTFPHFALKNKNFSFNYEFKSYCDCDNDCSTRATCACHQLNEQAAGKFAHFRGTVDSKCQYKDKRLIEQVATGIFECNSKCRCTAKCSNRVVQNGIRARLQVQKTLNKGWGVITLDDIPPGAFICTYAAELLDDADQYGDSDMYYADLDYITVNEAQKLGVDSDSDEGVSCSDEEYKQPDEDSLAKRKALNDRNDEGDILNSSSSSISSFEQCDPMIVDNNLPQPDSRSRYPKRANQQQGPNDQNRDNRRRENQSYRRIHELLGSHDFTLDARMQGNIGRFFNHSCDPNSHAQNVFIETHDLRFPVVAFFSNQLIKAMDEITWNYNYKMGAIEGRRIDCHCGASNCKGRIL